MSDSRSIKPAASEGRADQVGTHKEDSLEGAAASDSVQRATEEWQVRRRGPLDDGVQDRLRGRPDQDEQEQQVRPHPEGARHGAHDEQNGRRRQVRVGEVEKVCWQIRYD